MAELLQNSTNSFFSVELILDKVCHEPNVFFEQPGNYFQPLVTLLFTIFVAVVAITYRRCVKLVKTLIQIIQQEDPVIVGILTLGPKVILACQQPEEVQAFLMQELKNRVPDLMVELNKVYGKGFSFRQMMESKLESPEPNKSDQRCGCLKHFKKEKVVDGDLESGKQCEMTPSTDIEGDNNKNLPNDGKSLLKDSSTPQNEEDNLESMFTRGGFYSILKKYFENQPNQLQDVNDLFENASYSTERQKDQENSLMFLVLNLCLSMVVMFDFYSYPAPKGEFVQCQIPYFLSIVCFKPFALPMWACLTVTCQYTFSELMFGDNPSGRDSTGACVGSSLPNNIISTILISIVTVLLSCWVGIALVFYLFPILFFSPILIIPGFFLPFFGVLLPTLCLGYLISVLKSYLEKDLKAIATCPGRHGLLEFVTASGSFCNKCEKEVERKDILYGCRLCEVDLCEECFLSWKPPPPDDENVNSPLSNCWNSTKSRISDFFKQYVHVNTNRQKRRSLVRRSTMKRVDVPPETASATVGPKDKDSSVKETKKHGAVLKIFETNLILKMASAQLILVFMVSLGLIQCYKFKSYTWQDGAKDLLSGFSFNLPTLVLDVAVNFSWPSFAVPRFQIEFALGIGFIAIEFYLVFGKWLLHWVQSLDYFLIFQKGSIFSWNRRMCFMFACISWLPYRSLLDISRTSIEGGLLLWSSSMHRNNLEALGEWDEFAFGFKMKTISWKTKLWLLGQNFQWAFGMVTLIVPFWVGFKKPLIKVFDESATEDDIRDFCNDEAALGYRGLEIVSTKSFNDLTNDIGMCVWLTSLDLSKAPNLKFRFFEVCEKFTNLTRFSVNSQAGNFESLCNLKKLKSVSISNCDATGFRQPFVDGMMSFWKTHPKTVVDILFDNGLGLLEYASKKGYNDFVDYMKENSHLVRQTQPLITIAAKKGKFEEVEELLQSKVDVNEPDNKGCTALTLAAGEGYVEIVELLLKHKARVDIRTTGGETALTLAAQKQYDKIVELLLQRKPNMDIQDQFGSTALSLAATEGHVKIVELFLQHKAGIEVPNKNKSTPLILAAGEGHLRVVELLLKHKANVEAIDIDESTPLFLAALGGFVEIVEILIKHKASLGRQDEYGSTVMTMAANKGHDKVVELLLKHKANAEASDNNGNTSLTLAAAKGYDKVVALLLQHKVSVDVQNKKKSTALTLASSKGHDKVVALLLKHKASVDLKNKSGDSALSLAAEEGHDKIVELLLQHKASMDFQDEVSMDPHHCPWLQPKGHAKIVELLLQHKANADIPNQYGSTALSVAVLAGHVEVVELLLQHKASVDILDENEMTALMLAAEEGHDKIVELLLKHKASVDLKNKDGETAMDLGAKFPKVMELFSKYKAK